VHRRTALSDGEPCAWFSLRRTQETEVHRADRRLVKRVLDGDARAAATFADRFQRDLFNLFCWLTRDPDLADDLTQDTLLRCWERLSQYRGEAALRTWVHRVALSRLAGQRRADARERRATLHVMERQSAAWEEHSSQSATRLALADALGRLPEPERRAVVLCKLQGFTLREAAAMLDVPVGTIAWQVATAVKKLRDLVVEAAPAHSASPESEVTSNVSDRTQAARTER
jgi:RNA polymerase sigma-70 factor (ECF subfamily)